MTAAAMTGHWAFRGPSDRCTASVTDRRNGATDVRRNGASNRRVKRRPEGVKTGSILQPFAGWL